MTTLEIVEILVRIAWLIGAVGFVIGLSRMNSPATARNGNLVSAGGMAIAIVATAILILVQQSNGVQVAGVAWVIIAVGVVLGGGLGLYTARTVKMTAMPQLVSLFNAVGGGAAALIAIDDYLGLAAGSPVRIDEHIFIVLDIIIGSITFTGSIVASGKLQGLIPGKPIRVPGGQLVTLALAAITVIGAILLFIGGTPNLAVMLVILAAALVFGVTMTLPIGGA
ncbi:MAG TPA: NAD(P)(+) transhydrogenase (Re/Si-specific) subunit beta, partial [Candidatus Acidoferrum sp.]|nr:NAD(P)(+) transhydrogenase (Re/Si-specific) subunit beta [Candidatus Acidoferrum sp.]